jgi:response regulator of citrate/malate metabolism
VIRVLVVDDDYMVARVNAGYVRRVPGFEVVGAAHTAAEALEACEALRPDLVLLDIYLPDRSGLDVLAELRGGGWSVDVLVISAARDVEVVSSAMQGGVVHYLVKPFPFATFRERLERYAEARRRLVAMRVADQDDVDRVYAVLHGGGSRPLPKGLSPVTHALVASVLRDAGTDLSAGEAAERAGLSRVSARRYLEHLVATGAAELAMRYGIAGRPEHRYRWAGSPPAGLPATPGRE